MRACVLANQRDGAEIAPGGETRVFFAEPDRLFAFFGFFSKVKLQFFTELSLLSGSPHCPAQLSHEGASSRLLINRLQHQSHCPREPVPPCLFRGQMLLSSSGQPVGFSPLPFFRSFPRRCNQPRVPPGDAVPDRASLFRPGAVPPTCVECALQWHGHGPVRRATSEE